MENGWVPFFSVLRLYLERFAGEPAASCRPSIGFAGSVSSAWTGLTEKLGLARCAEGDRVANGEAEAPILSGAVKRLSTAPDHREMMLLLEEPAPGVALLGVFNWENQVRIAPSLYFYGARAEAVAEREEKRWREWLQANFSSEE